MPRKSLKTKDVDPYDGLTLPELESRVELLEQAERSPENVAALRALRHAVQRRCRIIKAKVEVMEKVNDRFLIFFRSTKGFYKLGWRSVLFFRYALEGRIAWVTNVLPDSDTYNVSPEGIISVKRLDELMTRLAEINVVRDEERSDFELCVLKLPNVYSDVRIEKFRNRSTQEVERLSKVLRPDVTNPKIYELLRESVSLARYIVRYESTPAMQKMLLDSLMTPARATFRCYMEFANPTSQIALPVVGGEVPLPTGSLAPLSRQSQALAAMLSYNRAVQIEAIIASELGLGKHQNIVKLTMVTSEIENIGQRMYRQLLQRERKETKITKSPVAEDQK